MYIIAEIGINHNGDINIAKELIVMAKGCGANAVKFQKRSIDVVYTPEFLQQKRITPPGVIPSLPDGGSTQYQQKAGLEFNYEDYVKIEFFCKSIGIEWSASAWDIKSLEFIEQFDPPWHKIASPMMTNLEFLKAVADTGRKVIASTGMCTTGDILRVMHIFSDNELVLMHCISEYPVENENCRICRVKELAGMFPGHEIGYSGHERGYEATLAAVVMGAKYIERHITLDHSMYGSDQKASLKPSQFAEMIESIKVFEQVSGNNKIFPEITEKERENAKKLRYWL